MEHYDLVIIGSGSGNSLVTPDFDDKRVAIVERGTFGGTCLNVGCIPTKMFVYTADVAAAVANAGRYNIDATFRSVNWAKLRNRVFGRIDPISQAGLDYRASGANTTAILGQARFTGDRQLEVETPEDRLMHLSGDQVVVAAGAHPHIPAEIEASGVRYHTSDTIMRVPDLPRRVVIVGGGYIACEFAHILHSLGSTVTVIVRGPAMMRHLDAELSTRFTQIATRQWDVRLNTQVVKLTGGANWVRVRSDDGDTIEADVLLVATGRHPNSADLDLPRGGVAVHPDGRVVVDDFGRTSAAGVWALGDICSPYQLKHVANHEARAVAHNLVHPDDLQPFNHTAVPYAVFTDPQVASVGATEEQLRAEGRRYVSYVQRYGDTAYGWAMEDQDSVCKVLADPQTHLLLGVHILGPQASTLIQPAIQAMALGQRVEDVARGQYWIHPALSEVLENALLGLPLADPA